MQTRNSKVKTEPSDIKVKTDKKSKDVTVKFEKNIDVDTTTKKIKREPTPARNSSKQRQSEMSTKRQSSEVEVKIEPASSLGKKRQRPEKVEVDENGKKVKSSKQKKKREERQLKVQKFFEKEACEDNEEIVVKTKADEEHFYSNDQLQPKCQRLDKDFVGKLENKYKDMAELDEEQEQEVMHKMSDFVDENQHLNEEEVELHRDVNLPSNKDSKLWRVKVKIGMEREMVFKLTNKLFDHLNRGEPLSALQVFECETTSGAIYVEAHKLSHVDQLIRGISGVYSRGLRMIPIKEMVDVMKACGVSSEDKVVAHQWVRISKGAFKNDLGLVEQVKQGKALVRLIPRIPNAWLQPATKEEIEKQTFKEMSKNLTSDFVKVPQRRFNPQLVKNQCRKEVYKPVGKSFYFWRDMMYRNGYLYHWFKINKLIHEDVCPMLEEVRSFQVDRNHLEECIESDQDEWDLMDDKTVMQTIRNDVQLKIQVQDRVEIMGGQFQGCKGVIQAIHAENFVSLKTIEKCPMQIKVKANELHKFFEIAEQVRIIQGLHAGEAGTINEITSDKKHAVVMMDNTKQSLKVQISNLCARKDDMTHQHNQLLADFLRQPNAYKSKVTYLPGDLIQFDNHLQHAIVLQVQPDALKVLLENNKTDLLKISQVQRKIVYQRFKVPTVTDAQQNAISLRSIVKILATGPFQDCIAEIKAICKNRVFVWIKHSHNQHLLRQSHGYFVLRKNEVVNAGSDNLQKMNTEDQAFMSGNLDRKTRDKKLTGQTVYIRRGELKGYKGKVLIADENTAQVQIFAKGNTKMMFMVEDLYMVDATSSMRVQDGGLIPMAMGFNEAAQQEFVNVQDQDPNMVDSADTIMNPGWGADADVQRTPQIHMNADDENEIN